MKVDWTRVLDVIIPEMNTKLQRVRTRTGQQLSPKEAVVQAKDNFMTLILSKPEEASRASLGWAISVINLIGLHASCCSRLFLFAVKGGAACDEEIAFIQMIMPLLGFRTLASSVPVKPMDKKIWKWSLPRTGAKDYTIELVQFKWIGAARCVRQLLAHSTNKEHSCAPNLFRYAAVSCATTWGDGSRYARYSREHEGWDMGTVNDSLNAILHQASDVCEKAAMHHGRFDMWRSYGGNWHHYFEGFPGGVDHLN